MIVIDSYFAKSITGAFHKAGQVVRPNFIQPERIVRDVTPQSQRNGAHARGNQVMRVGI